MTESKGVENHITIEDIAKLHIGHGDILIVNKKWDEDNVQKFAEMLNVLKIRTTIVVADKADLDVIPIRQFYDLMKQCEQQLGLDRE